MINLMLSKRKKKHMNIISATNHGDLKMNEDNTLNMFFRKFSFGLLFLIVVSHYVDVCMNIAFKS